jgi:hypothetical protein
MSFVRVNGLVVSHASGRDVGLLLVDPCGACVAKSRFPSGMTDEKSKTGKAKANEKSEGKDGYE